MKNNLIIFTIIFLLWNGTLFSSQVPRFLPEPLLIKVSYHQDLIDIDSQYVTLGQSFVGDFLKISPVSGSMEFTHESDLFRFIAYTIYRYKNLGSLNDLMDFTYVEDREIFEASSGSGKMAVRILEAYHDLDYMEYVIGWFYSEDIYCAYLRLHSKNGKMRRLMGFFTFRTGEWKVLSGISFSGQLMQDITMAGMGDDLSEKIRVTTVPDALSAIKDRVLSERITVKTDLPVLLQ